MDTVPARVQNTDMTFTLPRFSRRTAPAHLTITAKPAPQPAPAATTDMFMADVFMEVALPQGMPLEAAQITVPGWTLRLWPQARLGDATLQAHAESAGTSLESLLHALHNQGIQTLGLRRRAA